MSYDLIIKNGTVIDGTGAFRRRADVAVKDGKVAEIGKVTDGAAQTIDASDLIVSPGFVDPHTHYDAQICWDPLVSCTSWHGVTWSTSRRFRSRRCRRGLRGSGRASRIS
jgi:N-acyl-D-amino-acid deacylase